MVKGNWQRMVWAALALGAAVALLPLPAGAQWFGSQYNYPRRPPPPSGGFFGSFFGGGGGGGGRSGPSDLNPFYRPTPPAAPVESYKAPLAKKYETPPANTILVIGDSMADWLAYGLEDVLADTPDVGVVRKINPTSGLVRYDPRNETLDWPSAIRDYLADQKPNAIVVMLGLSDRLPLRDKAPARPASGQQDKQSQDKQAPDKQPPDKQTPDKQTQDKTPAADAAKPDAEQPSIAAAETQRPGPGGAYEFHTDKWAELYSKRIDDMIAALKSKGVPVLWVGLPAVYGTKSTSDMSYLDELFRARAEHAGIAFVDIWDGFVDENGRYVSQGPDFEGQIRRLRTGDGVHFTKSGADKLAQYVVQDLRRALSSRAVPVALPAVEGAPPKPGSGPRPAVGPVLPLTADTGGGNDGNALIGDGGRTTSANADPTVTRVLTHGDSVAAPTGRADDFAWPRRGGAGTAEAAPEAPAPAPQAAPTKAAPANPGNPKKSDDTRKAGPVATPAPAAPAAVPHRAPSASLDGAPPRPPAPVGRGF
jgi:uncharacterized protein